MLNREVKQKIQRDIVLALNVSLFGRCRTGAIVWRVCAENKTLGWPERAAGAVERGRVWKPGNAGAKRLAELPRVGAWIRGT
jgi:hypothetical protein